MTRPRPRLASQAFVSLFAALVLALVVAGGSTHWLPRGAAGIDHLVVPLVAFPVVWVAFALTLFAARRRARAWAVIGGLAALHALLIARDLAG